MNSNLLYKFLICIRDLQCLSTLEKEGVLPNQIFDVVNRAKNEEFIKKYYRKFFITELGIKYIKDHKIFIENPPLNKFKINKISLEDIYIPSTIGGVIRRWRTSI